jgi:hypothetical protein
LLSDLLDAMDNTGANGGVYFLGSIVLIKSPNDPQSKVIDGQQRLTTLTILLSVLRDLTTSEEVRFNRRGYIFQKANPDSGTKDCFRLLLRQRDRGFFQKYIQNNDATKNLPDPQTLEGSQWHIAENGHYLRSQLETLGEARRNALVAFIIQRCYLVLYRLRCAKAVKLYGLHESEAECVRRAALAYPGIAAEMITGYYTFSFRQIRGQTPDV